MCGFAEVAVDLKRHTGLTEIDHVEVQNKGWHYQVEQQGWERHFSAEDREKQYEGSGCLPQWRGMSSLALFGIELSLDLFGGSSLVIALWSGLVRSRCSSSLRRSLDGFAMHRLTGCSSRVPRVSLTKHVSSVLLTSLLHVSSCECRGRSIEVGGLKRPARR